MPILLVGLLLQANVVVSTRDGRRIEGRAYVYGQFVEIEGEEVKLRRLFRHEVLLVDPSGNVVELFQPTTDVTAR